MDATLALFYAEGMAPIYGQIQTIRDASLSLEILDQMALPNVVDQQALHCLTRLSGQQLRFDTRFIGYDESAPGSLCIRLEMPCSFSYLQRRGAFRLDLIPRRPVSCFLSVKGDEIEISVADVSLGGVGLLGVIPGVALVPGLILKGARVELSSGNCLIVDLEVRSQADYFLKNGIKTIRTGTQFKALSPRDAQTLMRYINRVATQQS